MSIEASKAVGYVTDEVKTTCTDRDAIIYALGIGYSINPKTLDDLVYTYELHEDFKVFPTFATCLHRTDIFKALTSAPGMPNFNPMMLLHGEQKLQILKPLKANTNYVTRGKLSNIADKGKGALIQFELSSHEVDEGGKQTLAFVNTLSLFVRGLGGFGHKGNQIEAIPAPPKRNPCHVVVEQTQFNQAIVYRLSGDTNPLHIDPVSIMNMAEMGNFERPILHGLCTYGLCAKAVLNTFAKGDGNALKLQNARFTSHVFPGERLAISMWKEGYRVYFTAKTEERKLDVIVGFVDLNENAKL